MGTGASAEVATNRTGAADAQSVQLQTQLKRISADKPGYVAEIVSRWDNEARDGVKFDPNLAAELYVALSKLQPLNLAAAGEATSFAELKSVLKNGTRRPAASAEPTADAVIPAALGDFADDLVFTPLPQCRIVDTRNAGGIVTANTNRAFDVDGSSFTAQGGSATSCGIPFDVATAVVMQIHSVGSTATGTLYAWSITSPQPSGSLLNFQSGVSVGTSSIVPVAPGAGNDFYVRTTATSHVVIEVIGYFAAPVATALNCTSVASATTAVPVNAWTAIDAVCPAGTTATGGGFDTVEGTLGYPGVWVTSVPIPNGTGWRAWVDNQTSGPRSILSYARCCSVPGR